jgi:DNA-binding MarR family transcriptional regulator
MPSTPRDTVDEFLEHALQVFPTLDPEVEAAVDRIAHLDKRLKRLTESGASRFGLNYGEFKVVVKLRQVAGEALSPGTLADVLALSTGAMTNRLDRLEEAGFVARERDPDDRRGVVVRLTDAGRTAVDGAVAEIAAGEQRLLSALKPGEQRTLNALLRTLMLASEERTSATG